jgi:hypothetical protein
MAAVGKSVRFEPAEINELLDVKYGSPRVFPILATLYPGLDMTKAFHEDHIFPHSRFTLAKLLKEGVPPEQVDDYVAKADAIPRATAGGRPGQESSETAGTLSGPHFSVLQRAVREERSGYFDREGSSGKISGTACWPFQFFDARRRAWKDTGALGWRMQDGRWLLLPPLISSQANGRLGVPAARSRRIHK